MCTELINYDIKTVNAKDLKLGDIFNYKGETRKVIRIDADGFLSDVIDFVGGLNEVIFD